MLPEEWKKEIEDAVNKADARNAERHEAQIASQNAIGTPLNRLANEFDGYKAKQDETKKSNGRREWAGLIGIYLSAFLVFVTAVIFYCQLRASEQADVNSNRAWLAVTDIKFTRPLDSADGPEITGVYNNVGRSPALDVRAGGTWTVMPAQIAEHPELFAFPTSSLWGVLDSQIRSQCLSVLPLKGGQTTFPKGPGDSSTLAAPKPLPQLKNVIDQNGEILIAPGCLTYRSFGEVRHTGFCRYASFENKRWLFRYCPVGNFAK